MGVARWLMMLTSMGLVQVQVLGRIVALPSELLGSDLRKTSAPKHHDFHLFMDIDKKCPLIFSSVYSHYYME